jgi:hypothetical protein
MAVQSPLRKVFRSVFSNTFNLTVNFLSRIGGGSVVTYLSRLMTTSTMTPFYSGTTNIVDSSATGDYREIQPGRCLDFNGATQYVEVADDPVLQLEKTDSFSLFAWVKTTDSSQSIISNQNGGANNWTGYLLYMNSDGTLQGQLASGGDISNVRSTGSYNDGEWHLLGFNYDGSESALGISLYADGADAGFDLLDDDLSGSIVSNAPLQIGYRINANSFDGLIHDARIYNRVLTDAEITAIYRQGLQPDSVVAGQPDATNLVGRWLLDDNSETTSYDSSGNGNHGTIAGYASGMLYEGSDVPYSAQNLVGHSERINLMPSTYLFDLSDWSGISATNGTYEEITLSNGQPGFRISTNLSRYYRTQQQSIDAGDYTLKMYCENIDPSLTRPMAQAIGSSVYGSILPGDFVNGWAEKTFTHTGGTLNMRCGLGCNANETGSGSADFTYVTLEAGDTTGQLTPQQCQPGSGFVSSGGIAPRDESDPANDVLGNPLDYTGTVPKYATPVDAPCLTIDGNSILLNPPIADASTSHTWTAWVKVANDTSDQYLFDKEGGTRTVLNLQHKEGSDNISVYSGASWYEFAVGVIDGTWHHVAFKISGTTAEIFVDGVSGGTATITETSIDGDTQAVGARYSQEKSFIKGGLCDFRVYNTALSATDIAAIYAGEEIDSDPIFHLPLSEGDGSTVYDVVNGNSYTITGYASTMWDNKQSQLFYSFENGCRVNSGVSIPALIDGFAAADGNPLTGLPGLLNSDTYNLNILPQPDAPYQRSAIPGATFDGVGDYVACGINVNTFLFDFDDAFFLQVTFKINSIGSDCLFAKMRHLGNYAGYQIDIQSGVPNVILRSTLENRIHVTTPAINAGQWYTLKMSYDGSSTAAGVTIWLDGIEQTKTVIADNASGSMVFTGTRLLIGSRQATANFLAGTVASVVITGKDSAEYDFRENNGLVVLDRSGNGNDGTLVVNSSLSQIFAPTPFETAYTLGDGRTRPHYVTVDSPNEKDFRTEII